MSLKCQGVQPEILELRGDYLDSCCSYSCLQYHCHWCSQCRSTSGLDSHAKRFSHYFSQKLLASLLFSRAPLI